MPFKTNGVLPDSVKNHLPQHAQDIYREAFNHSYIEYSDSSKKRDPEESREEISHKVAWSAVKKIYQRR